MTLRFFWSRKTPRAARRGQGVALACRTPSLPRSGGEGRGEEALSELPNRCRLFGFTIFLFFSAFFLTAPLHLHAQHQHVNAGALSTVAGSPLYFINGDSFVTNSSWVFNSVLRTNGPAIGLYDAAVTFTAAGSDGFDGPPAAPGAQLALVVKALSGPEGSSWAFWESIQCDEPGESITFSLTSGETNRNHQFPLSQNSGLPGEDPFGHCHGRRITLSKPGLHIVTFQIIDVSRNGPGGGSIHTPSPLYRMYFQAGTTIARLTRSGNANTATFATRSGSRYYLEANSALDAASWETVAGPVTGNNRLQTLNETGSSAEQRFYRLRITTP